MGAIPVIATTSKNVSGVGEVSDEIAAIRACASQVSQVSAVPAVVRVSRVNRPLGGKFQSTRLNEMRADRRTSARPYPAVWIDDTCDTFDTGGEAERRRKRKARGERSPNRPRPRPRDLRCSAARSLRSRSQTSSDMTSGGAQDTAANVRFLEAVLTGFNHEEHPNER
jgi:hypothetical protein